MELLRLEIIFYLREFTRHLLMPGLRLLEEDLWWQLTFTWIRRHRSSRRPTPPRTSFDPSLVKLANDTKRTDIVGDVGH